MRRKVEDLVLRQEINEFIKVLDAVRIHQWHAALVGFHIYFFVLCTFAVCPQLASMAMARCPQTAFLILQPVLS